MARGIFRTDRVIAALGVAVLALGAICLWAVVRGEGGVVAAEPAGKRVVRQARELLGRTAEIRMVEAGRGRVVCGYVGRRGETEGRAFISRPNRMLLSDDPLAGEFAAMFKDDCPGLPKPPPVTAIP